MAVDEVFGDRVLETSTITGTGNPTLLGAVAGYRALSAVATINGQRFTYTIAGGAEWEVGKGTRLSATTFSRDEVIASSNAGALVSFTTGTKEIWINFSSRGGQAAAVAVAKNLIINGGCSISQVNGANPVAAPNGYIVDQWQVITATSGTLAAQQVADAPSGFKYSLKITVSVADISVTGGEFAVVQHSIEGYRWARMQYGSAGARSTALGFWVKAHRIGTYTGSLKNAANNRSFTFEYSILVADTWEYKTVVIPGDTGGTWVTDGNLSLTVTWSVAIDTALYAAAAGAWAATGIIFGTANQINGIAATNDTWQITGVNLIAGPVPVPAETSYQMVEDFEVELRRCQRYYEKSFDYSTLPAQNVGTTGADVVISSVAGAVVNRGWFKFQTRKRGTPSMTGFNPSAANAQFRNLDDGADTSSSTVSAGGESGFIAVYTGNAANSVGDRVSFHWIADARM